MSLSVSAPHGLSRRAEYAVRNLPASPRGPRAAAASRLPKGSGFARSNPRRANKSDSLTSGAQDWIFSFGNDHRASHYHVHQQFSGGNPGTSVASGGMFTWSEVRKG
jgi:hypothetical protein